MNSKSQLDFSKFKSNSERKKNVLITFYITAIIVVISIIINLIYYFSLEQYANDEIEDISLIESIYTYSAITQSIVITSTIVFFAIWFRRSYANLERMGINIDNANSMAVWSFFIPIVNLFKPLRIAKEIDFKYDYLLQKLNDSHQSNNNSYGILVAWWIVYWINNIVSRLISTSQYDSFEQALENHQYLIINNFILLLSIGLTILMIRTIGKSEDKLEQYIKLEELNPES